MVQISGKLVFCHDVTNSVLTVLWALVPLDIKPLGAYRCSGWSFIGRRACVKSLEMWTSDTSSDLDRFLVDELRILLEEMRMESFTGIELEDLVGYARSWHALSALEEFLKAEVHHRIPKEAMWCLVKKHDWRISFRSTVLVFHH